MVTVVLGVEAMPEILPLIPLAFHLLQTKNEMFLSKTKQIYRHTHTHIHICISICLCVYRHKNENKYKNNPLYTGKMFLIIVIGIYFL